MRTLWILMITAACVSSTADTGKDETGLVDTDSTDETDTTAETGVDDTGAETDDTDEPVVVLPDCTEGTVFLSWTKDAGATLVPVFDGPLVNTYTWGVAISPDDPTQLWGEHGGTLWHSEDAGCTWEDLGQLPDVWWQLKALPGNQVVGYRENGGHVLLIDGKTWESVELAGSILGLGTDPADPSHLRVGTWEGKLFDRVGSGKWSEIPGPVQDGIAYSYAFDPEDPDRIVAGMLSKGPWFTHDGGQTWTKSTGFGASMNAFTVMWSPVDADVVWVQGLDITEMDGGSPSGGRHVWRSEDGGASFTPVVDQGGEITLSNGVPMAADPHDADVVWFSWGSAFQNTGTWLYRYDHGAGSTTWNHTTAWDEYRTIAPSPHDPELIYLGVVNEQITLQ